MQKIVDWPLPQTGKELSAFLGFTNYYRDFLPGFANVTAELNSVKNNNMLFYIIFESVPIYLICNFGRIKHCLLF